MPILYKRAWTLSHVAIDYAQIEAAGMRMSSHGTALEDLGLQNRQKITVARNLSGPEQVVPESVPSRPETVAQIAFLRLGDGQQLAIGGGRE